MATLVCPQCEHVYEPSHRFCPVCGFPVAEVGRRTDDPLVGTTLPGGYVILELVSVGGMGRVYRAEQKTLGRTVAVKIIHPHLSGDESASVRFITEARATSRLNHPNSVAVIDFGKNGGQLYLVMEFLRGRDLARLMAEDGLLSFARVAEVMCQVLAALSEAHHLGIIHRDLKPENIVIERLRSGADFVKVVDFGLAKIKQVEIASNITSPGIVCGTPDFMAPEQARGDAIDARSDLYACGVILFQLLTGRLPFEADSPTQVVLMHLSVPPPDPREIAPDRDIPSELAEITLKALEKDPARRYQSAEELTEALRQFLADLEPPSRRYGPSSRSMGDGVIQCASCGNMVPAGQKFCGECGVPVARAARGTGPQPGAVATLRLPLPLTAREPELEWLDRCRDELGGSVLGVRIIGEHGVGKTRLLREFLNGAADDGDFIVETRPDPWWAELAYFALRQAIITLAGLPIDGGRPADWVGATPEARSGLGEIFNKSARPLEPSRSHVWSEQMAGVLSPEDRRFITAEALRWAVTRARAAAGDRRIVLTIDDLHAIDGVSRNAFADVLAEPPLVSMLLLAAHHVDFDPRWDGPSRHIGGLPGEQAAALTRGATPPRGSNAAIDSRAIPPLYVDQVVRYGTEGGGDAPARMADLIALRIARLPVHARRTLQAIAVVGDAADRPVMRRLLPDVEELDGALDSLLSAGMIDRTDVAPLLVPFGRLPGSELFKTTHPLLREVALTAIPAAVRRDLHARVTEDDDGEPLILPLEVQALHAYHAQDSLEALMLLEIVADRAATRGDVDGCVLALRRGLDLARREIFRGELEDPVRAVLIFSRKLGDALARSGALIDANGVLREALDLAGPNAPDRAVVLGSLAFVAHERERDAEAAKYAGEAIDLATQAEADDLVQSLLRMRASWETA